MREVDGWMDGGRIGEGDMGFPRSGATFAPPLTSSLTIRTSVSPVHAALFLLTFLPPPPLSLHLLLLTSCAIPSHLSLSLCLEVCVCLISLSILVVDLYNICIPINKSKCRINYDLCFFLISSFFLASSLKPRLRRMGRSLSCLTLSFFSFY